MERKFTDKFKEEPIKSYKDGRFIVFENINNNKTCKYDLGTNKCIGFSGKEVKDIKSQLRGYHLRDIINSFENENYRAFLDFIDEKINFSRTTCKRVNKITNIGSFLLKIKDYSKYEQFFAIGLKFNYPIYCSLNQIPKKLVNLCIKYNRTITNFTIDSFKAHESLYMSMFSLLEQGRLEILNSHDIFNMLSFVNYERYLSQKAKYFHMLIEIYNYNAESLFRYVNNIIKYEAINDDLTYVLREICDYAKMQSSMNKKYDKYPRYFLTTHKITCRNYNRFSKQYEAQKFNKIIKKEYDFKSKINEDYTISYPRSVDELKETASKLNNCLCSYIDDIINGTTDVVIMRNKKETIVALEIDNNLNIIQARGSYNRLLCQDEENIKNEYQLFLNKIKI